MSVTKDVVKDKQLIANLLKAKKTVVMIVHTLSGKKLNPKGKHLSLRSLSASYSISCPNSVPTLREAFCIDWVYVSSSLNL